MVSESLRGPMPTYPESGSPINGLGSRRGKSGTDGRIPPFDPLHHYNHHRPHRSIGRRTPHDAYTSRLKATPDPTNTTRYRTRHDTVDTNGRVTLCYRGRLHHIGIGRPRAGTGITMLIAERDIRIIDADTGEPIRHLTLDPSHDYQPQNAKH